MCLCVREAVDFFNQINMLYGTITEFCTEDSCPVMSAGRKYEYHWADGTTVKKPIKCSAPKYIDYLMSWVQCQLDDESLFPSRIGLYMSVCLCLCLSDSVILSLCQLDDESLFPSMIGYSVCLFVCVCVSAVTIPAFKWTIDFEWCVNQKSTIRFNSIRFSNVTYGGMRHKCTLNITRQRAHVRPGWICNTCVRSVWLSYLCIKIWFP